ncbi:MAG: hypothetical protein WBO93_10335, partial [Gammaproteobacteria bacterium]
MPEAPHHIYFIHGIGKHGADWVENEVDNNTTIRRQLEDTWKLYNSSGQLGAFDKELDLVSIHYDFVYSKLYAQWATEIEKLKTNLAAFSGLTDRLDPLIRVAESPANGVADDEFFYTHVFDVLWYWGNSLVQDKIIAEVADQIISDVSRHYGKTGHTFSIVAHSMGTSVAHKVIQALWTQPEYDNRLGSNASLSQVLKFRILMQVSNTSYVLSADRDQHYQTLVKPSAIANRGVCRTMMNVSNRYDFISEMVPFDPPRDEWLDAHTQWDKGYLDIKTARISSPNVHSICHYFENPLVHIPFFERVLSRRIPAALKAREIENFQSRTPTGQFKNLKRQFDALKDEGVDDIPNFIVSIKGFIDLIDDRSVDASLRKANTISAWHILLEQLDKQRIGLASEVLSGLI